MPVCYITLSEEAQNLSDAEVQSIRDIVAAALDCKSLRLDRTHISVRIQHGRRENMLSQVEIEVFAQVFWQRPFSRDRRSREISKNAAMLLGRDCASWITMGIVGYSHVSFRGDIIP